MWTLIAQHKAFSCSPIWSFRHKKQQIKRVTVSFGAIFWGGFHLCDSSLCWETLATNRFPLSFKLSQSSVEIISWTLRLSHVFVSHEGKPRDYVAFGHSRMQQLFGGGNRPVGRRVVWNQKERHHHHQEVSKYYWDTIKPSWRFMGIKRDTEGEETQRRTALSF